MITKIEKKYAYDDVLLVPKYSEVVPKDVDLSQELIKGINLNMPIISSPMDTVTEHKMAIAMAHNGGFGIIHKNMSLDEQVAEIAKVKKTKPSKETTVGKDGKIFVGAAIGHNTSLTDIDKLVKSGANALCLDSAHGHSKNMLTKAKEVRTKYKNIFLIVGNVATYEGAKALADLKIDAIRVGMGAGAICTTRVVAGIGVPQLSAVIDAVSAVKGTKTKIIADGGIRYSGDMVKALAAGAHFLMLGSLLASSTEAPGQIININNKLFKEYRGMGSLSAMKKGSADRYGQSAKVAADKLVPEGIEGLVKYKGDARELLHQYTGGIRSGFGYIGAKNIKEIVKKAQFIEITHAGLIESKPHSMSLTNSTSNYEGSNE